MQKIELLHEDLTYKIRGILYGVHNELGQHRNEKQYGDCIEKSLKQAGLKYEREKVLPKSFVGERGGRNRIDFVGEDRVILEIKGVPSFARDDYHQCLRYLVSSNKELALLVNFSLKSCVIKRILNPDLIKK